MMTLHKIAVTQERLDRGRKDAVELAITECVPLGRRAQVGIGMGYIWIAQQGQDEWETRMEDELDSYVSDLENKRMVDPQVFELEIPDHLLAVEHQHKETP